jgi:parvulin-like peptidyl-prolyl isomerase
MSNAYYARLRLAARAEALASALRALWAAGAALLVASALACGLDEGSTRGIVEVDGQVVPLSALRRLVENRIEADPGASRSEVARRELDRLIDEQVALNRAVALGIAVNDSEISDRIRLVHGEDFGQANDVEYRERVRRQMLVDRAALRDLVGQVQLPETTLVSHFERNRERYRSPERIHIRQIVVEEAEKARNLREQLAKGADFASLAREHSQGPEASKGGLLPPFARGELPEAFDRAFELEPGQVSDVIESPHGFHIFSLVEVLPPSEPEYSELREAVRVELAQERLDQLRLGWLADLRRSAKIKVNDHLLETL